MKRILLLIIPFFSSQIIFSQSVRASIDSSEVYIGQPFEYRILIEGSADTTRPDLPAVPGLDIQYKGASTTMVSSFGTGGNSSSRTVTHSWNFIARKTGSLAIPSFDITVDGKIYHTASAAITVKEAEEIEGFYLFAETDKKEYWVGEPVILSIRWLFSSSVSTPVFNIPFISSRQFSAESQDPPQGNDVYRLSIDGLDVLAMQSAEIYKGSQYSNLSFQLKLQTGETGDFLLDPVSLSFDRAEKTGTFRTSYKSSVIPSNKIHIIIKPLPRNAGKDIILSKGSLSVIAKADPGKVHIGDPVTYTIELDGALTPEKILFPSLKTIPELEGNYSIPDRRSPVKAEGGKAIITQTIRAKNNVVQAIPGFDFPYFDIEKGTLERASVPAVPLEVLETQVVTSSDLEATGQRGEFSVDEPVLQSGNPGLVQNFTPEITSGQQKIPAAILTVLIISPFLIFAGSLFFRYRAKFFHGKDETRFDLLCEKMKRESDQLAILGVMKECIASHFHLNGSSLTSREISEKLLEADHDRILIGKIGNFLEEIEDSVYSGKPEKIGDEKIDLFKNLCLELMK